jgi:hypothetical protein
VETRLVEIVVRETRLGRGAIAFTGLVEANALPGESSFNHEKLGSHSTGVVHLAVVGITAYGLRSNTGTLDTKKRLGSN